MDQWIFDAVVQALAIWIAYKWGQHVAAMRITRMLIDNDPALNNAVERARRDLKAIDAQDKDQSAEELRVERHGDQLYVYTKINDEFLAQGSTLEECLDRIGKRFPDRNFRGLLSKEQADALGVSGK